MRHRALPGLALRLGGTGREEQIKMVACHRFEPTRVGVGEGGPGELSDSEMPGSGPRRFAELAHERREIDAISERK
jgi:hypothetical protein